MTKDKDKKIDEKSESIEKKSDTDLCCCYVVDPCGCYADPCGYSVDPCCR